jgi:hypothetical protein
MAIKMVLATAALALSLSAGAAAAFPVAPLPATPTASVTQVTFWGRPFPYRYRWSARACSHYETVETMRNGVARSVRTCADRTGAVVSYKG